MSDEIAGPKAGGAFIKVREHLGHLVIVTKVKKVEERYDQKRKEQGEVLTVDWHCFNCEGLSDPEEKLLGHPHVASKIQRDGRLTLGYITQLQPKPGFDDGAFVLSDPREEDYPNVQGWWNDVKQRRAAQELSGPAGQAQGGSPWGSATQAAPQTPAATQPAWGQSAAPAPAPAASAPASSGGAAWGTTTQPTPQPAPAGPPTPEQVANMPLDGVRALIQNGILTLEQVRSVRQDV
jgi:hypothetical protein